MLTHHRWCGDDSEAKQSAAFLAQIEILLPKVKQQSDCSLPGKWEISLSSLERAMEIFSVDGWRRPYGQRIQEWEQFTAIFSDGSEVWSCHTGEHDGEKGRSSHLITRNGKVIAVYMTWRN
jgi:hypothetical protein